MFIPGAPHMTSYMNEIFSKSTQSPKTSYMNEIKAKLCLDHYHIDFLNKIAEGENFVNSKCNKEQPLQFLSNFGDDLIIISRKIIPNTP